MRIRRVVTGHDETGRSVFVQDDFADRLDLPDGASYHLVWGRDDIASFPDDGSPPAWSGSFPPVAGLRFVFYTIPPGREHTFGPEHAPDSDGRAVFDAEAPGVHTTATIDFEVVISGEVTLELDDGERRTLHPYDVVVQNGTRHRWHNFGSEPATMATVLTGAHHDALDD